MNQNDTDNDDTEHEPMSTREYTGEKLGRWESPRYQGMEYVCKDCGKVETFDGSAIKTRSPFADEDEDCTIHTMQLQNREAYWGGEIEPDEVFTCV